MGVTLENFKARDAAFTFGTIEYRLERSGAVGKWSEHHKLLYRSDGSFRDVVLETTKPDTVRLFGPSSESSQVDASTVEVFKGSAHQGAIIGPGGPSSKASNPASSIMPYPCKALGLGFSTSKAEPSSINGKIVFDLGEFERLEMTPTAGEPTLPVSITRFVNKVEPSLIYSYSKYRKFSPNVQLPSEILVVPAGDLNGKFSYSYKILAADFSREPSAEDVNVSWFNPNITSVRDSRVSPEAEWSYSELLKLNGGSPNLSLEKLLVFSKQRSAGELARYDRMKANLQEANRLALNPLLLFAGGATALCAIGFVIIKLQALNRKSTA